MIYPPVEARNYDLDLEIAERISITIDQLDKLPLSKVNLWRLQLILETPELWRVKHGH